MLQGTLDAATPYAGAQDAHKLLPSARMVVIEGGGNHGRSLQSPSDSCAQGYVNAYLATGALPQAPGLVNATCPAVPDPTPAPWVARRAVRHTGTCPIRGRSSPARDQASRTAA
jgi:hypothetical protein